MVELTYNFCHVTREFSEKEKSLKVHSRSDGVLEISINKILKKLIFFEMRMRMNCRASCMVINNHEFQKPTSGSNLDISFHHNVR